MNYEYVFFFKKNYFLSDIYIEIIFCEVRQNDMFRNLSQGNTISCYGSQLPK